MSSDFANFVRPERGNSGPRGSRGILKAKTTETRPGDYTERGCSFLGCRVVVCGQVKNVVHLVHSPIGCAYYSWDYRVDSKGYCFTTDLDEFDVIFGGEKKLYSAIEMAVREFKPDAVFVYQTCTTGLIGDDIKAIADKASREFGVPVLAFECAGFRGLTQNTGHKIASETLFRLIEGRGNGCHKAGEGDRNRINLIGDFNLKDAKELERVFESLGFEVICTFTANATVDRIKRMGEANLNVVQCSKSSIFIARLMEERFGIPYVEANFFGLENTAKSFREIAEYFPGAARRVEEYIEESERRLKPQLDFYREKLEGRSVFISHGVQRAIYWIKPFEELGMRIAGVSTYFGSQEEIEKIRTLTKAKVFDNPSLDEFEEILLSTMPDLVVSDDKLRHLCHKIAIPFLNGRGQNKAYSGFNGFMTFARDVYETLNSRIWMLARRDPNCLASS